MAILTPFGVTAVNDASCLGMEEVILITVGSSDSGLAGTIKSAVDSGTKVYILPMKTPEERKNLNRTLINHGIFEVV